MSTSTAETLTADGDRDDYIDQGIKDAQDHANKATLDAEFDRMAKVAQRPNLLEVGGGFPSLQTFENILHARQRRRQVAIDSGRITVRHQQPPMI